jgi:uncharacterized protein YndB with AHSA1/START domain
VKEKIGRKLLIARILDAPRKRVWKAWTDPERVRRWWGPQGFTSPVCTNDFRVGGRYLYCMRSPEGEDYWNTGVFREIIPFERIVYTDSFSDPEGNIVSPTHYGMGSDFPLETLITVTFEDLDGKTRLTLQQIGLPVSVDSENAKQGWNEAFDKLVDILR